MENLIAYLRQLNLCSMMLRVVLAMLMGGLIGYERERKSHPAGFRTYMLVAIGASLTVMMSQYYDLMQRFAWADIVAQVGGRTDMARFGAQVVNGIGFLGAGTILVTSRQEVQGLTTAAGLWASACMGLAIGAGFYECVLVGVVLILICLAVLPKLEDAINEHSRYCNVYVELDSIENLSGVVNRLKADDVRLFDVDIEKAASSGRVAQINAVFSLLLPKTRTHTELLARLSTLDGVLMVDET